MSDVRANSGVPVLAQFVGPTTPSTCAPLVVDSATGIIYSWKTGDVIVPAGSSGTVTSVSVATANGFSGTVANATSTPAITIVAGAITPTTVNALTLASQAVGFTVAGGTTSKTLTVPLDASVSGTNTGDQTTVTTATNQSGGTVNATSVTNSGLTDLSGASAGQVKFPATQNASADAHTLDDYQEAAWTPTVTSNSGTITTVGTVSGTVTKIGRLVFCNFDVTITTNGTGATFIDIAGMPYTVPVGTPGYGTEIVNTGKALAIRITGSNHLQVSFYDGTYPVIDGSRLTGAVIYYA